MNETSYKPRILLVMPKTSIDYQDWPIPPVGICYVSAALKKWGGAEIFCINLNIEKDDMYSVLEREIVLHDIDVVGTGGLIVNYHVIKEIITTVKKIKPSLITYIGGSLVTFSAQAVMRGIPADIGMIGEGEITACELAKCIKKGGIIDSNIYNVNGLIIRNQDGSLSLTPHREEISDIDTIPWPDYDGFNYFEMIRSFWNSSRTGIVSAPLTTSRSCPFNCTFCSKSGGTKYRQRSLDDIFSELDYMCKKYNVNRVLLNDELFAVDQDRIAEFCERISAYNVKWYVALRVSKHITPELIEMMKQSGCTQILYGLESGDDRILRSMRKGITTAEIERVTRITYEAGFQVRGNFIFGDPAETLETVQKTIDFIEKNREVFSSIALSPIILFPGSRLYIDALNSGVIDDELAFIEKECPVMNVSSMSDEDYYKMINEILPAEKARLLPEKDKTSVKNMIPVGNNGYEFEYTCDYCNQKQCFRIHNTEVLMRSNQYICKKCGSGSNVSVTYAFAKILKECLVRILGRYKVAFWGCGQNMVIMFTYMGNEITDKEFILVDTSEMKLGKALFGKTIHPHEALEKYEIDFVIEMTSVRHMEVLGFINRNYPLIAHAYSMFDIPLLEDKWSS